MHPLNINRNTLINEQFEHILVIKAKEAGVSIVSNESSEFKKFNAWKEKNKDNINKWYLEAEAIADKLLMAKK